MSLVDVSFLTDLSLSQSQALFIRNNLSLIETEFKNNTYWVLQKGKIVGEVMFENNLWYANTRWIPIGFTNQYSASILEIMQIPVRCIYSESFSQKIIKELTNV